MMKQAGNYGCGRAVFVEAETAVGKYGTDMKQVLAEMKQTLGVAGKNYLCHCALHSWPYRWSGNGADCCDIGTKENYSPFTARLQMCG